MCEAATVVILYVCMCVCVCVCMCVCLSECLLPCYPAATYLIFLQKSLSVIGFSVPYIQHIFIENVLKIRQVAFADPLRLHFLNSSQWTEQTAIKKTSV